MGRDDEPITGSSQRSAEWHRASQKLGAAWLMLAQLDQVVRALAHLTPREPFKAASYSGKRGALWVTGPAATCQNIADPAVANEILRNLDERHDSATVAALGLDFGLAAVSVFKRTLYLSRGPMGRPTLYVRLTPDRVLIDTTLLPHLDPEHLDDGYFANFLANTILPAPSDVNHTSGTPAPGWHRVPRAAVLSVDLASGRVTRCDANLPRKPATDTMPLEDRAQRLRDAVDAHLGRAIGGDSFACEVSGGIDSGIVFARSATLPGVAPRGGIAFLPPFPELRFEPDFVAQIASQVGVHVHAIDRSFYLPFARLRDVPAHDEPNLTVTSWALLATKLTAARDLGARVLLHGIGGDQIFMQAPGATRCPIARIDSKITGLSSRLRLAVLRRRIAAEVNGWTGDRFVSRGTLLYDGWTDRYIAPKLGMRYEPGLLGLEILQAARSLQGVTPGRGLVPKPVPRFAFAQDLPAPVLARRGKVGFDGVFQRGLRRHLGEVMGLVEERSTALARLGIRPRAVITQLERAASIGWETDLSQAIGVVAWCAWLNALSRSPHPTPSFHPHAYSDGSE